ncbi:hypothetical protein ACQUZK_10055, partial [Streptococcus pyogenes]|uniref:hypothetical protein n=1 Tax=Streptococcus pyogenes TaxID=1314 RepID=UPI003DA13941
MTCRPVIDHHPPEVAMVQSPVRAGRVLWDMLDGPMARGVLGLSDPNVHHVADRWVMFLGGFST